MPDFSPALGEVGIFPVWRSDLFETAITSRRCLPKQILVFVRRGLRSIEHHEHQIGIGQRFHRFLNSNGLGLIESLANAGGIDEFDRNASDRDGFTDQIARRSGSGRDDGALALDQAIEQT